MRLVKHLRRQRDPPVLHSYKYQEHFWKLVRYREPKEIKYCKVHAIWRQASTTCTKKVATSRKRRSIFQVRRARLQQLKVHANVRFPRPQRTIRSPARAGPRCFCRYRWATYRSRGQQAKTHQVFAEEAEHSGKNKGGCDIHAN